MNSIKVYVADTSCLEDNVLFENLCKTVSSQRREKINRISFDKDKRLSLGAELLLKKALSDIGVENFEVDYIKNGKPCIKGGVDLFFNLSHSGERVMCAISCFDVGCDVEKIKPVNLKIAERFFFENEYKVIAKLTTEQERQDMFFRLWTLKESFMKVTGLGMKLPLDSFSINISDEEISVSQNVDENTYYFKEYDLEKDYKYSVCGLVNAFDDAINVDFMEL